MTLPLQSVAVNTAEIGSKFLNVYSTQLQAVGVIVGVGVFEEVFVGVGVFDDVAVGVKLAVTLTVGLLLGVGVKKTFLHGPTVKTVISGQLEVGATQAHTFTELYCEKLLNPK